jgi:hypothetical protein
LRLCTKVAGNKGVGAPWRYLLEVAAADPAEAAAVAVAVTAAKATKVAARAAAKAAAKSGAISEGKDSDPDAAVAVTGRGLHSFTSQLNLSVF